MFSIKIIIIIILINIMSFLFIKFHKKLIYNWICIILNFFILLIIVNKDYFNYTDNYDEFCNKCTYYNLNKFIFILGLYLIFFNICNLKFKIIYNNKYVKTLIIVTFLLLLLFIIIISIADIQYDLYYDFTKFKLDKIKESIIKYNKNHKKECIDLNELIPKYLPYLELDLYNSKYMLNSNIGLIYSAGPDQLYGNENGIFEPMDTEDNIVVWYKKRTHIKKVVYKDSNSNGLFDNSDKIKIYLSHPIPILNINKKEIISFSDFKIYNINSKILKKNEFNYEIWKYIKDENNQNNNNIVFILKKDNDKFLKIKNNKKLFLNWNELTINNYKYYDIAAFPMIKSKNNLYIENTGIDN